MTTLADHALWLAQRTMSDPEQLGVPDVAMFPTLRQECPNFNALNTFLPGRGWTLQVCYDRQNHCRSGGDACQGRGWVPVIDLATLLVATYKHGLHNVVMVALGQALDDGADLTEAAYAAVRREWTRRGTK